MQVTVEIPDELTEEARQNGGDVSRELLEAYALEGYREGKLTAHQVGRLLAFETPMEVDAFLKAHDVYLEYDEEDFAEDAETSRYLRSLRAK